VVDVSPDTKLKAKKLNKGLGGGTVTLAVGGAIPNPLSIPLGIAAAVMAAAAWAAGELADDPPREDWDTPLDVQPRRLNLEAIPPNVRDIPAAQALEKLIEQLFDIDAYMTGGVRAIERAQGAAAANEASTASRRKEEADRAFHECARALMGGSDAITEYLAADRSQIPTPPLVARVPRSLAELPAPIPDALGQADIEATDARKFAAAVRRRRVLIGSPDRYLRRAASDMVYLAQSLDSPAGGATLLPT
jgi:hypothetical protein